MEKNGKYDQENRLSLLKKIEKTTLDYFLLIFNNHQDHGKELKELGFDVGILSKLVENEKSKKFRNDFDEIKKELKDQINNEGVDIGEVIVQCVLHQNFEHVEEFSSAFYSILELSNARQTLTRGIIYSILVGENSTTIQHGFDEMERVLLLRGCNISSLYRPLFVKFTKAVKGNPVADELESIDESKINPKLKNNYTIILKDQDDFYDVPFAEYFQKEYEPIINEFYQLINDLTLLKDHNYPYLNEYIAYIQKYIECLQERDSSKLEDVYRELDELWMDIKYHIQYVHDIEYGYCDSLRCKVTPDFSVRLVDEEYQDVNNFIKEKITKRLLDYFSNRNTNLGKKGVSTIEKSSCFIYYFPFLCGSSLNFRFSGQSIPNRPEVSSSKGVKIFFDPVASDMYNSQTRQTARKLFEQCDDIENNMTASEAIRFHIASHELGHASYNLSSIKESITTSTKTLLEEPRAQLTACFAIKLLYDHGDITKEEMDRGLLFFAAEDLSNFVMAGKVAFEPYIISGINCYGIYETVGYMSIVNDRIHINNEKSYEALCKLEELFETILQAEDENDGNKLETILQQMQNKPPIITWMYKKLNLDLA
ncbi:predicted protein [Naegleria gruberi]|uniref:Predicted protein n=1 Tax=Naegleria gruberi TaxID=5762 RepID=D2VKM1_NAEGR|nr:uncharacterized protein NAEGRDRAFT_80326 [Naegleria gruberi]EFC42622.1 predicted protein [Naegleria gruberi]|eukprot:XP_002675366.1 predicted protein [Naegleria gruberi strain NEG-M]